MKPTQEFTQSRVQLLLLRILCAAVLICLLIWGNAQATEYHVAKNGKDAYNGSPGQPFLTISKAASLAQPGDIITVHSGTYRELIVPANGGTASQRITYQAASNEKVAVKGSEIIKGWQQNGQLWRVAIPNSFFGAYNPYKDLVFGDWFFPGPNKVHTGEVYLNGKSLGEVAKTESPLSWNTESKEDSTIITAHFGNQDPNRNLVEINVRPSCFYPSRTGIDYLTILGFYMSQAATQWAAPTAEQIGLIGTNWSKGWIIENNIISDSKCVGIALGKDRASGHNVWFENRAIDGAVHYNNVVQKVLASGWSKSTIGSHLVKNNTIFRCGQAGVVGSFGAAFSEISGNHIYDIYTYRNFWGAEMAGIKLHAGIDALISGNRIHNAQKGIWLDWMTQGTRIKGNLLYDNDFVDMFLEVNHGPYLVDNNLFLSRYNLKDLSEGGAFVHNLFTGLLSRAADERTTPYFAPNGTRYLGLKDIKGGDNRFLNNIFIGNKGRSYYSATYPSKLPDEVDTLAGYGLAIYDHAQLPVTASGNLYLNGAFPLGKETKGTKALDKTFSFTLDTIGGKVVMNIQSNHLAIKQNLPIILSAALGKNQNGHAFTEPNGQPIKFDQDYFGKRRVSTQNLSGPLAWIPGKPITLWTEPNKK